jgi:UDP-N-acetylmuramate dehydrogenase
VTEPGRNGDEASRLERAFTILGGAMGDRVRRDFPLAPLTSFRLGGPAAIYVEARSMGDLTAVARAVAAAGVPMLVVGKGSNLLVADSGFPGIVVRLGKEYRWAARDGHRLTAGAAMPLPALAGVALSHSLSGLEFGVAIPASLGGSVRMNAGAHGRSLDEVLDAIEMFVMDSARLEVIAASEAGFRYRESALPAGVVTAATARLAPGDPARIRALMAEAREWRRATQPLAEPNCGSVFKNPPGDHAARLIESIGGKEMNVGGARVSEKHANFIVAGHGSTARDVYRLMSGIRERVRDRHGVSLEPEVHVVGEVDV